MKKFISLLIALVIFVAPMTIEAETVNVAKIGDQEYATLEDAINDFDQTKNSEITLIHNVTSSGMMIITKDVTINLNGYNISAPTKVFEVQKGIFTVTGTGTITNGANATVQLKQGALVIDTVKANENGVYEFKDVANGQYNIIVTLNERSTSKLVEVEKDIVVDIELSRGTVDIIVVGDKTPNVVVGGLEDIEPNKKVIFGFQLMEENKNDTIQNKLKDAVKADNYEFLDISVGVDNAVVDEINNILSIIVPYDLTGKTNIKLAHYHGDKVALLKEVKELVKYGNVEDGTYYVDYENNLIYIYSKKYSTYVVAYDDVETENNQPIPELPANPKTGDDILFV